MAAPTFVYIAPGIASSPTDYTNMRAASSDSGNVYYPPTIAVGDIAFLVMGQIQANSVGTLASTIVTPWAPGGDWASCGSRIEQASATTGLHCAAQMFWRRCDGSEDGAALSLTWTNIGTNSSTSRFGAIFTVSGALASGTPYEDFDTTQYNGSGGAGENRASPSVTTTDIDRLLIRFCLSGDDSEGTGSTPAGWTRAVGVASPATIDQTVILDWQTKATAGTVAADNYIGSANDATAIFSLAVLPAGAGGGTTRGMPFGNRSTAFNGGRIFTGPIN
jgi:hypothetical protein